MSFPEYHRLDAMGLAELIRKGEVSATEVVGEAIDTIERHNPLVNAVVYKMYDRAQARARRPLPEGPLSGVPFLLKDLALAYMAAPLTNGSRSMRHYVPNYNGTLAVRHEAAGLIILGKTNAPEFGLAPTTETELHGTTRNPWDPARTAGGSSGGAAAAVASGMVPMAHASDGGGSIRIPASANGLFGLKPTRARTPSGPVFGESWFGLSTAHALTRSVRDSAALLDATHGPEAGDPYAAPAPPRPFLDEVGANPGQLWIAVTAEPLFGSGSIDPECTQAVHDAGRLLESLGHRVSYVEVPIPRESLMEAFLTLAAAQAAVLLRWSAELAGKRRPDPADYETLTWVLAAVGRRLTAEDMAAAMVEVRNAGRQLARFHEEFDVLVTPTLAREPWPHRELAPTAMENRLLEGLRRAPVTPALMATFRLLSGHVIEPIPNTPLFNITGQPAMSVPLHWSAEGLPVGVQFAARFGDEATLLRLAAQLEQARPWFDRNPPIFG
jgi:amidase